ncbi:MAG: methyltransferase domain-containing protein [Candidatus Omnitrophica bacterium]|nr:methyltransferase domain-containing protein [Candidatus Omnitrophota bacterium]
MNKDNTSRVIDLKYKVAFYDPMNFFLYLLFGGERKFRSEIIKYANLSKDMSLLDIGCATGGNVISVLETAPFRLRVYGLDAAFNIIRYASDKVFKKGLNGNFVQAMAEHLPFKDSTIDRIINVFMLHHLRYEMKVMALKEMHRVLKKDGVLIVVDPAKPHNLLGKIFGFLRCYVPEIRDSLKIPLVELVRKGGFEDVDALRNTLGCFSFVRARKK